MECPLAALWGTAVKRGMLGLLDTPRRCRGQSSGLQPSQLVPESSGSALSGLHLTLLPQRCGITVPPGRRAPPGLNLGQSRSREQGTAGMVEPSLFLRVRRGSSRARSAEGAALTTLTTRSQVCSVWPSSLFSQGSTWRLF